MSTFFYGVIEGFYGRQWSWPVRMDYAPFLAECGFDCYIYAPKGDASLRSRWRGGLAEETCAGLRALGDRYHRHGLRWGLGLSPLGMFEQFTAADRAALTRVIEQLNTLSPDILCILFDDLRGDYPGLARRQLDIVEVILSRSRAARHMVCPTYYSFDPVLEQAFGTMPPDYLQDLGRGLPAEVGLCWTGERVVSSRYSVADIQRATAVLGRKPLLWDNYPVNDGKALCRHLHLSPYSGRPPQLRESTAAHLVNPMNQPHLSRLVLQSLQSVYGDGEAYSETAAWRRGLALLNNPQLADRLSEDRALFQEGGLDAISEDQKRRLIVCYRAFKHPAAAEVVEWLSGAYAFDPACLTG